MRNRKDKDQGSRFSDVGMLVAGPLMGLVYVSLFPFIGLVAIGYLAGHETYVAFK